MSGWAMFFFLSVAVGFGTCIGFVLGCIHTEREQGAEQEWSEARHTEYYLTPNELRQLRDSTGLSNTPPPYDWEKDEANDSERQ